jgi:hypothetical protein
VLALLGGRRRLSGLGVSRLSPGRLSGPLLPLSALPEKRGVLLASIVELDLWRQFWRPSIRRIGRLAADAAGRGRRPRGCFRAGRLAAGGVLISSGDLLTKMCIACCLELDRHPFYSNEYSDECPIDASRDLINVTWWVCVVVVWSSSVIAKVP